MEICIYWCYYHYGLEKTWWKQFMGNIGKDLVSSKCQFCEIENAGFYHMPPVTGKQAVRIISAGLGKQIPY